VKTYPCIPAAGTFSRSPIAYGLPPETSISEGKGAYVKFNDYQWRLDWVCGLGPNLLGYSVPAFDLRVVMQLRRGSAFSLQSHLEVEVGSKLVHLLGTHVPGWSPDGLGVRWGLSGSDACEMAVRLARAVTGKDHVISAGYHGSSPIFTCSTPPALGIPPELSSYMHPVEFNDTQGILDWLDPAWKCKDDTRRYYMQRDDLAAIIIEQPSVEPNPEYYPFLRRICDETGALLIVDEVVTGLRYALGGVCEKYDIHPDLVCMGKSLGNGLPISALVGPKQYMDWFAKDSPPFCSSTFWGNAVSLAAADAMLEMWSQKDVDYIWSLGQKFIDGMNTTGYKVMGHPPRSIFVNLDDYDRAFLIQGMFKRGILVNRPNFVSRAHTEADVKQTVKAATEIRQEWQELSEEQLQETVKDHLPKVLFRNR
jgi:glutamate-1-semialdehyde 2,1-aminomutase